MPTEFAELKQKAAQLSENERAELALAIGERLNNSRHILLHR